MFASIAGGGGGKLLLGAARELLSLPFSAAICSWCGYFMLWLCSFGTVNL
jgi:hypothetical protein